MRNQFVITFNCSGGSPTKIVHFPNRVQRNEARVHWRPQDESNRIQYHLAATSDDTQNQRNSNSECKHKGGVEGAETKQHCNDAVWNHERQHKNVVQLQQHDHHNGRDSAEWQAKNALQEVDVAMDEGIGPSTTLTKKGGKVNRSIGVAFSSGNVAVTHMRQILERQHSQETILATIERERGVSKRKLSE